ncbi:MAG: hypothetical protein CSA07_05240 [Bacteroidia bacterium]|nr:MAG: hypothetical protein CSA07_05240 [Bacteroidia bacterium]
MGRIRFLALLCILWAGASPRAAAQLFDFMRRDTAYVEKYHELLTVRPFVQARITSIGIRDERLFSKYYKANTPLAVGIGLAWKMIGISYTMDIPYTRAIDDAPTRYFDIQYHYYGRYITLDAYAMRYRGLYSQEREDSISYQPKFYFDRYGFRVSYLLRGDDFSYAAAFEQAERQKTMAVSFPMGLGGYYQHISLNHPLLSEADKDTGRFLSEAFLGISAVFPFPDRFKGWFFAGELTLGASLAFHREMLRDFALMPSWQTRFSLGYTERGWSLATVLYFHSLGLLRKGALEIDGQNGTLQLVASWRIFRGGRWRIPQKSMD